MKNYATYQDFEIVLSEQEAGKDIVEWWEPTQDKIPLPTYIEQRAKGRMKLEGGKVFVKKQGTKAERIDSAIEHVLKNKQATLSEMMSGMNL